MIHHNGWRPERPANSMADRYRQGDRGPAAAAGDDESRPMAAALHRVLFQVDDQGTTPAERLARALAAKAIDGDSKAIAEVFTRIDGAPKARPEAAEAKPGPELPEMTERQAKRVLDAYFDDADGLPRD